MMRFLQRFNPGWRFFTFLMLIVGILAYYCGGIAAVKDFGLPLAALFFTAGQLWLDEKKHVQQRKDQYWDKRLDYYGRLRELVEIIRLKFSGEDIKEAAPTTGERPEFKDTKSGKIYGSLARLEFEGDILFADIGWRISKIRENFEIIRKNEIELLLQSEPTQRVEIVKKIGAENEKIQLIFDECKKIISSYLRQT